MSPDATRAPLDVGRVIGEHARVRVVDRIVDGDRCVDLGTVGTIVHVHRDGVAFEIEFDTGGPFVVTAPASRVVRA